MAGVKKIVEYDVIINGVHELVRDVSQVEERIKKMKTEISDLNKQERDAGTAQEKARIMDIIKQREEELKVLTATRREMRAVQGDLAAITEKMAQMGGIIPINELKKFKKELTTQLDVAKVAGDLKSYEHIRDVLSQINKEIIERDKIAKATSTQVNDDDMRKNAEAVLARVEEYNRTSKGTVIENVASPESRKQLQDAIAYYEKLKSSFREMSPEAEKVQKIIDVLSADLNKYKDNVKRSAEEMEEFKRAAIMSSAANGYGGYEDEKGFWKEYSKEELTAAIKATEKLRDATVQSDAKYKEYDTTLTKIEERFRKIAEAEKAAAEEEKRIAEETKRANDLEGSRNTAGATMRNIGSSTVEQIKEAIEVTKKLRDEQIVNSDEWKKYQLQIEAAEGALNKYNDEKRKAAEEEKKFEKELEAEAELLKKRDAASRTMDHLSGSNISAIKEAVEVTKKLRDEQALGSGEWEKYQRQIVKAEEVLARYNEKEKAIANERAKVDADRTMNNLGDSSVNSINSAIEVYKRLRDEQKAGSDGWKDYQNKIEEAQKVLGAYAEEQKRVTEEEKKLMAEMTMSDLSHATTNDIKQAIEVTKKLRDEQTHGGDQWKIYQKQIEEADKALKSYNDEVAKNDVNDRRNEAISRDTKTATADKLREDIKVLEQWRDSVEAGNIAWNGANNKLNEAKKALAEYEEKLKSSVLRADGYKGLTDTLDDLSKANSGVVVSTKNLKRAEEELKKELKDNDLSEQQRVKTSKKLATVQQELARREKVLAEQSEQVKRNAAGYEGWSKTIDKANSSVEKLRMAQKELADLMEKSVPNSKEYKEYAKALATIKERLGEVNGALKDQGNWFTNAAERFAKYAATWLNFYQIRDAAINSMHGIMELSDSIADIQKVTKMSADEVDRLSISIDDIDTRASQEQLHLLGYQAGMLGLKSKEDILGFVNGANQMNWALKELGEEGAVNMMKVATATGDVAAYGVEGALSKLGSAINEITASSPAAAGAVTDVVSRLSALGSVANYSSSELVAIGSTLSSLNIPAERGATAVTRIMMSMSTKMSSIALHAGLSSKELKELKKTTDEAFNSGESNMTGSMAVMIRVLEALKEKTENAANPIEELTPIFGDMGKQGVRLAETLAQLVNNVDMVKEHVGITSNAFEEGVSMMNEYNIKNETAAALMARIGNNIRETFVNSNLTRHVETLLRAVLKATEGNGALYRSFVLLSGGAAIYGLKLLAKGVKSLYANILEALTVTNTWLVKQVAVKLGFDAETLAVKENTVSKTENVEITYAGAAASDVQTAKNATQTLSWHALFVAIKEAHGAAVAYTAAAAGILGVAALVGTAIWYLCTGFEKETELQKSVREAAAETEASMMKEMVATDELFSKLEELTIKEEEEMTAVAKAKLSHEESVKAKVEDAKSSEALAENVSYLNDTFDASVDAVQKTSKSILDNSEAKVRNAEDTNDLSLSDDKLNSAVSSLKDSTDKLTSSTNDNSGAKEFASGRTKDLRDAEDRLKRTQNERRGVIEKIMSIFPGLAEQWNLEEGRIYDIRDAYAEANAELRERLRLMTLESRAKAAKDSLEKSFGSAASNADQDFSDMADAFNLDPRQKAQYKKIMGDKFVELVSSGTDQEDIKKQLEDLHYSTLRGMGRGTVDFAIHGIRNAWNRWSINSAVEEAVKTRIEYEAYQEAEKPLDMNDIIPGWDDLINKPDPVTQSLNKATGGAYGRTRKNRNSATRSRVGSSGRPLINTDYELDSGAGRVDEYSNDQVKLQGWAKELDDVNNMPHGSEERRIRFWELTGQPEPTDPKKSHDILQGMATRIKDRLKNDFHVSDNGKALHTSKTRTKHESKGRKKITLSDGTSMFADDIKSDQTAALSALRGYYETRKQKVKEDYIANRITTQAKDSMLSQLEMDYKFDLAELYKKLLGEESKFQQTKYGKWFEGKNLEQLSKFLLKMGKSEKEGGTGDSALIDGMRANGEKAYNDALDVIIKHMDSLHKIFLQYDYTGSINEAYQKKLEEVDLFWGAYQERMGKNAQETAELQIRNFKELAEQSLGWNASDLRKKMESMKKFNDWFKGKDDTTKFFVGYDDKGNKIMRTQLENDLEGLLIILQNYRHELIDAQKKVGDEGHKRALEIAETAIETQTHIVKTQEANEALLKSLQSEGYVKSSTVDRYEIEHIKQRIEYQNRLIQLIQLEKGDTKKEFEVLTSLKEKLIEKNEEIQRSIRENVKAYVDVFNEMTSALTTAGNEHASLTALAEIAAKRRLGIAVDTTKKEYMIYSRNGKAVRKMMTEEEKLTWDMQNDARNQQLDALVKWLHDWGQKIAEDMTNALSSQVALEQQKEHEQKMLEQADEEARGEITIAREKSESIQQLEDLITSNFRSNINTRLAEAGREMAERVKLTEDAVERINALNMGVNNDSYVSDFANVKTQAVDAYAFSEAERSEANRNGIKVSPYTWDKFIMESNSELFYKYELDDAIGLMARNMLDNLGAIYEANAHTQEVRDMLSRFEKYNSRDVANLEFDELDNFLRWLAETDKYGSNVYTAAYSKWSEMVTKDPSIENRKTYTDEDYRAAMQNGSDIGITKDGHSLVEAEAVGYRKNKTSVVEEHKEAKQEMLNTEIETNKAMTDSHKRMVLSMISAMNMYGIAYNAVMNDSLSVSQRVGLATLQSFGQVATSMLSAVLSEAIASMTIEDGKAVAKIWGTTINPAVALPLIAVVTGAIGAAMAAGTKAITKSKQEISAITGAASGKKVAAGMLTYAEGNYPVLGSDGEVYDAKRETNWKTKVYSSPHYGILGEKGPELIVDGVTTRKMMTLRPDLYQDILDLARGRQAVRAKAYAEGNYPAMPAANASGTVAGDTNAMLVAAISQLNAQLAGGIKVAALGEDGAVRRLNEAEDWMRKHGLA